MDRNSRAQKKQKLNRDQLNRQYYADVGVLDIVSADELSLTGGNNRAPSATHLCLPCGKYLSRNSATKHRELHRRHDLEGFATSDGTRLTPVQWRQSWRCKLPGKLQSEILCH
jgi:hypothetical protein